MKTIDEIAIGMVLEDATGSFGIVTGKTANSVEIWHRRNNQWYIASETCNKCRGQHSRIYRDGTANKLVCYHQINVSVGLNIGKRTCGGKSFTEISREYTGVDSKNWHVYDKPFTERFKPAGEATGKEAVEWMKTYNK